MASYFLPSYFQKRLLKYALSRLDFLETDALDLENLGITFGQRSVIELKNVGIQIRKLAAAIRLPPTVDLRRARVKQLRLTIPADLNRSGIVVELVGVDIDVGVQEPPSAADTKTRGGTAPSRGSKANRTRISSPVVHDPGGAVIPTSQDLAVSFLQAEPIEEKHDLQAAIQSNSVFLQDSTLSTASGGEDVGLGLPGGISLPTFVADFFKGIADRLSVEIRQVTVAIKMELPGDRQSQYDPVEITFKMAEVKYDGLQVSTETKEAVDPRRAIAILELELLLSSELEVLSPVSSTASPKLSKSTPKLASISTKKSMLHSETFGNVDDDLHRPSTFEDRGLSSITDHNSSGANSRSSSDGVPAFASTVGLGLDSLAYVDPQSMSNLVQTSLDSRASSDARRPSVDSEHAIDNRAHAEELVRTQMLEPPLNDEAGEDATSSEDLSESKYFTHDEAESMYMSAVGGSVDNQNVLHKMPGAWDWPSPSVRPSFLEQEGFSSHRPISQPSNAALTSEDADKDPRKNLQWNHNQARPVSVQQDGTHPKPTTSQASLVAKRILIVDHVSILLPGPQPTTSMESLPQRELVRKESPNVIGSASITSETYAEGSISSNQLFRSGGVDIGQAPRSTSAGSVREDPLRHATNVLNVRIGKICAMVDMPIGRTLVRIARELQLEPSQDIETSTQSAAPSTMPSLDIRTDSLSLRTYENVSLLKTMSSPEASCSLGQSPREPANVLLQVFLSGIKCVSKSRKNFEIQQISVEKLHCGQGTKSIVCFEESSHKSIGASAMLRQDDVVIAIVPGVETTRIEVQLKPLHVALDLLQLDDVLSRSGGLSSILELGSSIASTSTVQGGAAKAKPPHSRQRSVRFDAPTRRELSGDAMSTMAIKMDLRLAGATMDLVGSESSMVVKASGIKVIYRMRGARVQIDQIKLTGPMLSDSSQKGAVDVKLVAFKLDYLVSPEEKDYDRLLSLLTPSSNKYDKDDDIMVDTLLRQRRKGSVLRLAISGLEAAIDGLAWQQTLLKLADELSKLSSVAKYLPDDDRPGILTLAFVERVDVTLDPDKAFGPLQMSADLFEAAHISVPSLLAIQASTFCLSESSDGSLISELLPMSPARSATAAPMLMCRFIADEMEPVVRFKLSNTCIDYRVSTLIALLGVIDRLGLQSSNDGSPERNMSSPSSSSSESSAKTARRVGASLIVRDSAIGLQPAIGSAKGLLLLTDAAFSRMPRHRKDNTISADIKKASVMIIDDATKIDSVQSNADHRLYFDENDQLQQLVKSGFVPVGYISSASAVIRTVHDQVANEEALDIEFRNNLFILETCADSTQVLIQIISNLSPPSPPPRVSRYRTEVVPIEDMLASFTGNAYFTSPGPEAGQRSFTNASSAMHDDDLNDEDDLNMEDFLPAEYDEDDDMTQSYVESELGQSAMSDSIAACNATEPAAAATQDSTTLHSMLDFREEHFARTAAVGGTAHRWDSTRNTYGLGNERDLLKSPVKLRIRDVHVIWNLFDGYDWQSTRDTISQAVRDIEGKAASRRPRSTSRFSPRAEDDEESVIGDFLFNSIYIGIPANKNAGDLANVINNNIDDQASETGSYATGTTVTTSPTRQLGHSSRQNRLRLNRSNHHKMSFELKGISADFLVFPRGSGEVESSVDIRIKDLEIFDHLPTSTWKKFATYMQDAGEREVDTNMLHLEILNVKPVADLSASEMILKITVLPLRLHIDQDALDFMTRFFEFKDERGPASTTVSSPPFLQRVEVNPVRLRLDFKPKRVDYGGLRSGRTTEFMNFFVLDRADMVLRRVILYGVSGFDRLGIMLNNIWTPDVKRNQLPGILGGLAPIRPIVDVGSGLRELVVVPMREYKKDGRIVRSIQKGAFAFASTTAKELVNLGAKLAIGTQNVLQNTETMLGPSSGHDNDEMDSDKKQTSLYADQPVGIVQGLRGAYASLERDLLLAKDAIVAVPGEVMASGSAAGAARAVLSSSPTIILRPAIGASKAIGQTLLGAGNAMDKRNLRRIEEKYKRSR